MKWFRFYHASYRNPKVQNMRPELFRFWVNTLCVASESEERGTIPSEDHLRLALGLPKATVKRWVSELEASSLLHRSERGALTPHDWEALQPDSDDSAKRKRDERARASAKSTPEMSRDMSRDKNVTVTSSRARALLEERREEESREEESPAPPPPSIVLGPEYTQLGEWAIGIGACVSWGTWVSHQGMCGHSVKDIRAAIEEAAGAGKLNQGYVAAKLRAWAAQGGRPKPRGESNGKTAVQQRPEETRIPLKPRYIPEGPEGDVLREMWGIAKREATG